ncbi:C2H2- zinc finger protein family protein [Dioscorea alata]|uniref:C2H2- zinc finger protein family protein n=2 Tax=Dioscorea alata TaxID=55571 RepID=A0ACB7V399_DIOAL|nr:C2H2- zinc finger protein family protein [Dioscorea alata]KAH7667600.1 C2H2- zinc finger protein family protein [Dioscorea alata]
MERVPQWSHEETLQLLKIRAEMDKSFMETKRNKVLWETVSMRMRLLAFPRTAEQCKSKWKNLLTRFKGSEAMEGEAGRQFPFHEEMQRIFSERMMMRLDNHEGKGKEVVENESSDDDHDHDHEEYYDQENEKKKEEEKKKKKKKKRKKRRRKDGDDEVVEVLKEILRRQREMEERWMKELEEREEERRVWEEDWKRTMEELLVERMEMERRWREREEERKARDEAMADRRHSLLTAILTKLSEKL